MTISAHCLLIRNQELRVISEIFFHTAREKLLDTAAQFVRESSCRIHW